MIHLTIDGKSVEVPPGSTILQAARMNGIAIPTLCDHPALKPYGSCRICVVEVEGMRTLQASCATPAVEGMVVRTDTLKLHEARKFVLSLLFSERNHFCMYCQKTDGDCELQNCAYAEEMDHWSMQPSWTSYPVDGTHPHYVLDNNRCILCRRCVRACGELVGNFTLAIENRGYSEMLVADSGVSLGSSSCIHCGTCVQVCPTGALIDRQSAYLGKDATAARVQSICTGCSVGCGIEMMVHDHLITHINGDWNSPVNHGLLCELGRYQSLPDGKARITSPMVRKHGQLEKVTWAEAINTAANRLSAVSGTYASDQQGVVALASTRLTAEALHEFKWLFREKLGSQMVASIEEDLTTGAHRHATRPPAQLHGDIDMLKTADCVVVFGADLVKNHQVAGFFIKRNLPKGTHLIVVDPYENRMDSLAAYTLKIKPGTDYDLIAGLMAAMQKLQMDKWEAPEEMEIGEDTLEKASQATGISTEILVAAAREMASAREPAFVYGKGITASKDYRLLDALVGLACMAGSCTMVNPKGRANSMAAHAYGLDQCFEPKGAQAAYLAIGDEQPYERLLKLVEGIPFLAIQASYASPLTERADVVLPVEVWTEQEGHFMNLEGRLQAAHRGVSAPEGVRSNLEVLRELGRCLNQGESGEWQQELSTVCFTPVALGIG